MATPVAEIHHVYAKPMTVQVGDEVVRTSAGDLVTNPEQWGRSLQAHLEAGNIVALPVLLDPAAAVSVQDHTDDELLDELARRDVDPAAHASDEALLAEVANRDLVPLAQASDEDLLTEVGRRGLDSPKASKAEGEGAGGAADDLGGVGDDAPTSQPSASVPSSG